jgi:YD repeat-containing protein
MIHDISVAAYGAVWSILRRLALLALIAPIALVRPAHADNAQYYYDPDGRLVGVVDPVNGSAVYSYDATGNILSVTVNPVSAVSVVGFDPPTAAPGGTVTIGGTGFDTSSDTTVSFNGVAATPNTVTATSITVAVPAGAATGPVTVTAPAGSTTSAASFIVVPQPLAPQITSFSPAIVAPGDSLTITGSNFDPINGKVEVANRLAPIVSATTTSIVVTVPVTVPGPVIVESPAGKTVSTTDLVVTPGYPASVIGTAQRIAMPAAGPTGTSIPVTVTSGGQIGLAWFDVAGKPTGAVVETNNSLMVGTVQLIAPDGAPVSPTSVVTNQNNVLLSPQALNQTGTYLLVVTSTQFGDTATGSVTLNLYNVPPLTPDAPLTVGGSGSETLTTPGQVPVFTFTGTVGQQVQLVMQSTESVFGTLSVMAPDGVSTVYAKTVGSSADISGALTLPQTGTYTYMLTPSQALTGTVTLNIETPIAGTIAVGGSAVTEDIAQPGDFVTLTFPGTAGQVVRLVAQTDPSIASGNYALSLTEPDGQTQLYSSAVASTANLSGLLTLPTTGTYTIQIVPMAPTTGNVTVQLDVPVTGTISPGGAVTETVTMPGDAVTLSFSGTAGQVVRLVSQPNSSLDNGFYRAILLEPDGQTQLYDSHNYTAADLSGLLTLPSTGTYMVQFIPDNAVTGAVTLSLDTPLTGMLSLGGATVTSNVTEPGGPILLSFAGTAGQVVELATQPASGFYTNSGSFLTTWYAVTATEPDGQTQLYSNQQITAASAITGPLTLPQTGTYSVLFVPNSPATGSVAIQLDFPPTGTLTIGGVPTILTIATGGETGTLSFAGTAGQVFQLVTEPSNGSFYTSTGPFLNTWYTIIITEPNGSTQLYNSGRITSSSSETSPLTLPVTGTYTIQFVPTGSGTGNVTFELDQPVDGSIAIGGAPVTTSITEPGDSVDLTFSGTAGQQLQLVTTPSFGGSYTASITEPNGSTQLYSHSTGSSFDLSGLLTLPATGTYAVQFLQSGANTGTVTMQLQLPVTGVITLGGPSVTSTIASPGDLIDLSFAGTSGQAIDLLTQPTGAFYNQPGPFFTNFYYVIVTAPDGQTQLYDNRDFSSTDLSGPLTLSQTGTYSVEFVTNSLDSGNVAMTLYDGGTSVMGANDFTAAIPAVGATAQLAFSASSGSRVSLLTQADSNLRAGCFTIALMPPGSGTPFYSSTQSSPTDFSHALTLPSSGLYTMLLTPCGSNTGTAALTLYTVPADVTGSATIGGGAVSLATVVPGQNAQVTFPTSAAGQAATIAVTADNNFSSACYNVTVTDPNGNQVNIGQGCGTAYSTADLTLGVAGTYHIAIASVSTATGNVTVGVTP